MIVASMYHQYARYLLIFSAAHASTTVTDDRIRIAVFMVPTGTLSKPCGHIPGGASSRKKMYAEKSPPKSITSDARNNQMPTFAFQRPVSGRVETVYGISIAQKTDTAGVAESETPSLFSANGSTSPLAEGERIEVRGSGRAIALFPTLTLA